MNGIDFLALLRPIEMVPMGDGRLHSDHLHDQIGSATRLTIGPSPMVCLLQKLKNWLPTFT
jgi:hypothetical protein